jgi:hypothetical protein
VAAATTGAQTGSLAYTGIRLASVLSIVAGLVLLGILVVRASRFGEGPRN